MSSTSGQRVLIVEDEPNIIEAIRFILSRDGCTVWTHSDGATAVQAVRDRQPDVLILDVMLPDRSGYDILADLRADPSLRDLRVLMLTARGQSREREMALRLGADRFMTKPFANAEILQTVRDLAGSGQRAAES